MWWAGGWHWLRHGMRLTDEAFVDAVYRVCLGRAPDPVGQATYLGSLRAGTLTRHAVWQAVVQSVEFRQKWGLPPSIGQALHAARIKLVQQRLPPAERVLDLGGASSTDPRGALLQMGYPHVPREIIIVDLPLEARHYGGQAEKGMPDLTTAAGTRVHYHYGSMVDLAFLADQTVDLVWSGESIEHVSEADGERMTREAFRVLRPGGHFCLDTPNAVLTRLESPDAFAHPEHQKEYTVPELQAVLRRCGFEVTETLGLAPMPESVRRRRFIPAELTAHPDLADQAETSYLMYLKGRKPAAA